MTKVELRQAVLEYMGVVAAGEISSYEDGKLVDDTIDASMAELKGLSLAPFDVSAIPAWAQISIRDYVAGHLVNTFGLNPSLRMELAAGQARALQQLSRQLRQERITPPIKARYY